MNDFPKVIELQLHNMCNANCIICPYSTISNPKTKMDKKMFQDIIHQCSGKNIDRIIPYLNNEPFLDKDFISDLKYIRSVLPDVEIEVSTNVSALNEEKIKELLNIELTELRLSIFGYSQNMHKKMMPGLNQKKVMKNVELISKYFADQSCTVSIVMIDNGQIPEEEFTCMEDLAKKSKFEFCRWGFLDRAKNVEKFKNEYYNAEAKGCQQNRPIERMHILSNGDVIFCCQDWSREEVMGNINDFSLEEIWINEKYQDTRLRLYSKNLSAPEICKRCKLSEVCAK